MTTNTPDHAPPPRWNWEERARRAESLLSEMDSALSLVQSAFLGPSDYTPEEKATIRWRAERVRQAWTAHRADLETLDGRDAQ